MLPSLLRNAWCSINEAALIARKLYENCTYQVSIKPVTLKDTSQAVIESAQLNLNVWSDEGETTNLQYNHAYTVSISPGQNTEIQSMSITIQKS
ncbi:MAG: hypothetical protein A3F13_01390 [Gammaproteobacteria bacterium RIFCSPHIGHO2_12_FULL_40_19]|nr:MAG: hypothetical protein A3F13_01390 [Gammaproteobacteria bacterium RIFCSPHIGHO2_12_FULL_40_19]